MAPDKLLEGDVRDVVIQGGGKVCVLRIKESTVFAKDRCPHPENDHRGFGRHFEDNPEKLVEVQQPLARPGPCQWCVSRVACLSGDSRLIIYVKLKDDKIHLLWNVVGATERIVASTGRVSVRIIKKVHSYPPTWNPSPRSLRS